MIVAYHSLTGNVRRFAERTAFPSVQITPGLRLDEPFVLVTPTIGFGRVPDQVAAFLAGSGRHMIAVAASGNRNFSSAYAAAGDHISGYYGVPLLLRFELAGTDEDVRKFNEAVTALFRAISN
ncbi:class Ib ribonucleoside-diphosphate reductase assembly flavoprotein NrdI [Paenibacillus humicus]|uniref:class Ib ribonucleoside-diphosphate reductase assembly flavoprotein NrdI n=1 Tax=Paenibacillus humicus TaxID=412861 RepID=UPI000FD9A793|nr:class Ib ribonucleoside-diphosphate reductase assembly flavoprotein NrdI [Paenibacillus humicus]